MSKISDYITETRGELSRVNWPSRRQAIGYTAIVILISVFTAVFLGAFDFLFTKGIEKLVL